MIFRKKTLSLCHKVNDISQKNAIFVLSYLRSNIHKQALFSARFVVTLEVIAGFLCMFVIAQRFLQFVHHVDSRIIMKGFCMYILLEVYSVSYTLILSTTSI